LEDLGIDGVMLKWILKDTGGRERTAFITLVIAPAAGCLEYGNKPSSLIKFGKFLAKRTIYFFLRKGSALCS
jgi:hypothetical protein